MPPVSLAHLAAVTAAAMCFGASCSANDPIADFHMIPGSFAGTGGPDGNTYIYAAADGLVVIDTGRHIEHAQAIIDFAHAAGRTISAIINTHWHLDHTTGNADLNAVFPHAKVYATVAAEGALDGFLEESAKHIDELLVDPEIARDRRAGFERSLKSIRSRTIMPTDPVKRSMKFPVSGRNLEIELAEHAVTEADLWIWDPATRTAIIGDLVTVPAPFFDTACPSGWGTALDAIEQKPFERIAPGHGALLSREEFHTWRRAFNKLLACAAKNTGPVCAEGWLSDAAAFISAGEAPAARAMIEYYVDEIIRSPEKRAAYCPAG